MRNGKGVLLEAALMAIVGLVCALAANALSPRGLRLSRNYFPGSERLSIPASQPAATGTGTSAGTNLPQAGSVKSGQPLETTLRRLEQHGLQPILSNEVVQLFGDPRYEQGLVVLIDARDDQHYQAGHIPGAWQFDHYHADQYFPAVLPACLNAQKVVVYCSGGACEDSEFAAIMLRDAGVPRENLLVYAGGISEWQAQGRRVETGARRSGALLEPKP
jgi:rhodanese-related sulfurtransferase